MGFWTTIINAFPQSLAIAILTSVFTGLLIFYFQKRINKSFDEKMAQFKTDLQKELVEHQIKFSKTFPRTLEILEEGNKRLRDLSQYFSNVFQEAINIDHPLSTEEIKEKNDAVIVAVREFSKYFNDNKMYLLDELFTRIDKILNGFGGLGLAAVGMWGYRNQSVESLKNRMSSLSNLLDIPISPQEGIDELDEESQKRTLFYFYWSVIEIKYMLLSQEYEQIYKSVAEPS